MKLCKLGLLALTVSLVAAVIILDKKNSKVCGCDNLEEDKEDGHVNSIIVDEPML